MVLTLLVEAIFAAVFVRVLVGAVRHRDPLGRDVAVMFSALAVLFVLELLRRTVGEPPQVVGTAASVLLVGQPFLILRVVRRVAPMPGWVYWPALVGWAVCGAVLLAAGADLSPAGVLLVVAVFVVTEVAAAVFLVRLARARIGAPRARLWLAAAATVAFAAAIMVAGAGAAGTDHAEAARQGSALIGLASAIGYLLAFAPPARVRRVWSTGASYGVVRELVHAPADASAEVIWYRYAQAVRRATGSASVVVLDCSIGGQAREVARVGAPTPEVDGDWWPDCAPLLDVTGTIDVDLDRPAPDTPAMVATYARVAGLPLVTAASLRLPGGPGVLMLLDTHRSLFTDDDVHLLGELGAQASALAQRAELLADRDRLTGELSASVEALTAASKAKSDFMANMSHELRTPLNAIIGFSDLMRAEVVADGQATVPADWIGHIYSSGQHLLSLINEVLDLSKIESGVLDLRRRPVDLPEAIEEVVGTLAALSQDKGLDVTTATPPLRVHADPIRLRQILTNLLSNAIKFTPTGGRVYITAHRVGPDIALSVADTGPGIAPADQQRVFEEFQQAGDEDSRAAGTGLGLALTRRLVNAHGGHIELHSVPGHGATFTVFLPAADAPVPESPDTPIDGGVLIIEDDPAAAQVLTTYLHNAGYQVRVAATGEQGLADARAGNPAAIVLDLLLPGIDGWQVLAELKRDNRLHHIPVLIISVLDHTQVSLALDGVDYMVKPVDRHTLLSWMARHGFLPPGDRQLTVLAIDDDPHSRELIHAVLAEEGITVVTADGGTNGLRAARAGRFELIICDLLMPDVDGFDVIAALHNDPATHGTPIVVLTAHTLTDADKDRLAGKVVAVTNKADTTDGLPHLVRTIGELTGLSKSITA